MNKPIHFVKGQYPDEAYTPCGLGDYSDRGFENGTTDRKKVTCKNCLKSVGILEAVSHGGNDE